MNARVKASLAALVLAAIVGGVAWVIAGLADFDPDTQPVGYVGQPEVSSSVLYTGTSTDTSLLTRLYALDYDGTDWSGNLHSYRLSTTGAVVKTDDWSGGAAARIDGQLPTSTATVPTGRYIVTRDGGTGVAFRWSGASKISDAQKAILDPDTPLSGKSVPTTSRVLDYIRGDRSNEGPVKKDGSGGYRARGSALGDIIHSTPLYCPATAPTGIPAPACTVPTVFVGANDGMLHAINATTGTERFAYIPSVLLAKLANLKDDPYTHRYYVDGLMDIRNYSGTTILAGALGAGGKGLYALDVTDAGPTTEAIAASKIKWEITNASTGYANLGYTYGQPVLTTLTSGTAALVVGNGYNNSGSGKASLFLIDANNGTLIREITNFTGDAGSLASRNGLSSPKLLFNGSGQATYAYAGDLDGNLWKIKLDGDYAVTRLHTVDPAQSITMKPGLFVHPNGGYIVAFVTGRMLSDADATDTATHYAYGIWDSAPVGNTGLLAQTLAEQTYTGVSPSIRVRTATTNAPNWNTDKGWRTPLPRDGERVFSDGAFVRGRVFQFLSTNPTIASTPPTPSGENWWMQLDVLTGGDTGTIRFDLNASGSFTSADQVTVSDVPTSPSGRHMGGGRRSQLIALSAGAVDVYQSNYDKNTGTATPTDVGVSGGHFDYDIYYYNAGTSSQVVVASGATETKGPFCLKTTDVNNQLGEVSPTYCKTGSPYFFSNGYNFMTAVESSGNICGGDKKKQNQTITCSQSSTVTILGTYANKKHVHEYDDIYDVTGVNMLAASDSSFNLSPNVIASATDTTTPFKVLVMNQYLSPAAKLAIGPNAAEESVKSYGNLASQTDATILLGSPAAGGLKTYTRNDIGTFLFNLPKEAFQSKDWWGTAQTSGTTTFPGRTDGDGTPRAGLIPTQTGCVNKPSPAGVPNKAGLLGERYDGALTIQLIKSNTPASALELNVAGDVKYGWRVAAAYFTQYVLAEYTTFWHHGNGKCYGDAGWVQNPPQDPESDAKAVTRATGSSDPVGVFGGPGSPAPASVVSSVTNKDGSITTTYSDGTVVITYPDGSTKITLPDGTVVWNIPGVETGGVVNPAGGVGGEGVLGPEAGGKGRINWRELRK